MGAMSQSRLPLRNHAVTAITSPGFDNRQDAQIIQLKGNHARPDKNPARIGCRYERHL